MIDVFDIKFGIIDLCIIAILLMSGIVGYNNGFIKEIVNVLVWLISIFATLLFFDQFVNIFSQYTQTEIIINISSFLLPFLLFFLVFTFLFKILFNNLNETSNYFINNFLGFLFGIFKGGIFIVFCFGGLIYLFNSKENFPTVISDSYFFEPIKKLSINALEYMVYII